MTRNEYDENIRLTDEQLDKILKESKAVQAITTAAAKVVQIVAKKHITRGDSWLKTTSAGTMHQLNHNKFHRIELLYKKAAVIGVKDEKYIMELPAEIKKEIEDELKDIIAYSAFQLYILPKIKTASDTGEVET